jgi:DNA end-binding protein Ku
VIDMRNNESRWIKAGHFDPDKFEDRYEDALKELLRKKQHGEKIERPKEQAPTNVVNLMDALRKAWRLKAVEDAQGRRVAAAQPALKEKKGQEG